MGNVIKPAKSNQLTKVKHLKKLTKELLLPMQDVAHKYCHYGYDLYFLHGWICATLSVVGPIDDDQIIPLYLMLNEDTIPDDNTDDQVFENFTTNLLAIYEQITNSVFEENKVIKPLVNLDTPNVFEVKNLTNSELSNLYCWLYGYLAAYLTTGGDIQDHCDNEDMLNKLFFPALFTLSSAFLLLDQKLNDNNCNNYFSTNSDYLKEFYTEFRDDIDNMWESDEVNELNLRDNIKLSDAVKTLSLDLVLPKIVESINAMFSVAIYTEANKPTKH